MQTGPSSATPELTTAGLALPVARPGMTAGWRRRRLALSRWRRLTRWEYWPVWALYPPVVAYCGWLALRHRNALLFTAVNPGLPAAGGVVGFSKAAILTGLAGAGERIATWRLIAPGPVAERRATVRRFMVEARLSYPIVLKPDEGERGTGVVIARDVDDVEAALHAEPRGLIAQAYVPGVEFGVFYVRRPGAPQGEIFGITEKRVVAVVGDGRRTLEHLILADDRAVGMARFFLTKFADRLDEVPGAGETVPLSELGTHCRGALFLDGGHLKTPALTAAIEAISRTCAGFHFGRYDVRAASVAAFQAGEGRVIELNGVTSEATNMYDPRHSVWFGWATLCRQWRLAFAIGAENRRRGARVWRWSELRTVLREHRQTTPA